MREKYSKLNVFLALFGLCFLLSMVIMKMRDQDSQIKKQQWKKIAVALPDAPPSLTQESIDLALLAFAIDVPPVASHPVLNKTLKDRGLSTRVNWRTQIQVEIGPSAFQSWALLGSTLAHELEVHCRQNFLAINLLETIGFDGIVWAEREAYMHEIRNAKRFGLDPVQKQLIAETMSYYYDVDRDETLAKGVKRSIGSWAATSW